MGEYEDDFDFGRRTLEEDLLSGEWDEPESDMFGSDGAPDDWDGEA